MTFTFKGRVSLKRQFFAFFFFLYFCVLFVCYHPLDTLSTTPTGQHELMGNTFILHSSFYILNDPVVAYDLSDEQPFSSFFKIFFLLKFFSLFFFFFLFVLFFFVLFFFFFYFIFAVINLHDPFRGELGKKK